MSKEHAAEFHAKMSQDPAVRDAVTSASEEVLNIAKSHGLHFSREDLADVLKEKWQGEGSGGADPATPLLSERPGA
jgi:predicted ribosomally synthesized peptide with nif11-like leader